MEREIASLEALEIFAAEFFHSFPREKDHATVVGLTGDLGSGKTAFTQALARAMGVPETVVSPTFVIAKFYPLEGTSVGSEWKTLVHMDAYRIEDPSELAPLGWNAMMADSGNLIVIEWPERIGEAFPSDATMLTFRAVDETTRVITQL